MRGALSLALLLTTACATREHIDLPLSPGASRASLRGPHDAPPDDLGRAAPGSASDDPASTSSPNSPSSRGAGASSPPDRPLPDACSGDLPPLASSSPFLALPVERHRPAVVSLPLGATSPRPVLVVAHGAGDRPEWQCGVWREIVQDHGFVLCVRGFPTNRYVPEAHTGYFYTDHHALGREITLALDALRARFPQHVDATAPAYAGFSQGAIMGAMLLPGHPARFARAALVEGGDGLFQEWNIPAAQRFRAHGGERVLFACGRSRCAELARTSAFYLRRGGVEARVLHARGAGHSYGGSMATAVGEAFGWVVEGDARWCLGGSEEGNATATATGEGR
ncbi:alpha/beta hydrolase [Chondromyces crocatus]|uniref:Phospholipase/carboxylesterase/thioesterase domain-containing protein n=1 Tax=Chondromyces crocatus TaxID=52 RepID=A0A0K1E9K6_CHOCO|nr:hypothetical protein [Chondromyces crocatus]AKT37534.1 uncharacterized protein CMC5_016750 [Chondromyces crocatus]